MEETWLSKDQKTKKELAGSTWNTKCYKLQTMSIAHQCPDSMTNLAGGFLVINYYHAVARISKSSLDLGRKQKRPLRDPAVDAWRG